jgi:hypothetical protein
VLVVAGIAASVGSDHMASAIKKSSTTSARSSTTTKPHPSNSGIKVNNVNIQRNLSVLLLAKALESQVSAHAVTQQLAPRYKRQCHRKQQ